MTLKEAILKSLEDIKELTNYKEVCEHIIKNKYYDFGNSKTPPATVSALLGDFIRDGDARVRRMKQSNGAYFYYLTKNEGELNTQLVIENLSTEDMEINKTQSYQERDLHQLLSTFLKVTHTYSKTIFHEKSTNGSDSNQIWTHPDMVGIKFTKLKSKESAKFFKLVNQEDTFKLSSYELKKEINSDTELKKAYFQAVSNSSWSHFGYLVAFEFNDSLLDEMTRLNQSFGIGIIELNANPYKSKILFPAKYRKLDFKTIDKLCNMNPNFKEFIVKTEKFMTAADEYLGYTEKMLHDFCDPYFQDEDDGEFEKYCYKKNIPQEINIS